MESGRRANERPNIAGVLNIFEQQQLVTTRWWQLRLVCLHRQAHDRYDTLWRLGTADASELTWG
jgi:hypothetical protein